MGTIVEFRAQHGRAVTPPAALLGKSAEIVIFPGIRIERWEEQPPEAPRAESGKSGRSASGRGRKRR